MALKGIILAKVYATESKHISVWLQSIKDGYCDSVIRALRLYEISLEIVWNSLAKLNQIDRENRVFLYWVPGIVGICDNEQADKVVTKRTN